MNENWHPIYVSEASRLGEANNSQEARTARTLLHLSLASTLKLNVSRLAILTSGSRKPNATQAIKIFQLSRISAMAKTGWQFSPWRRYSLS